MSSRPTDPAYLRQLVTDVIAFREAFEKWMEFHVSLSGMGGAVAPAVALRETVTDHAVDTAADDVSRAAGRIGEVARLTGSTMVVQGAGAIDPFVNWQSVARPKPLLEPRDIRSCCEFALGRLESLINAAEAQAPPEVGIDSMHPLVWGAAADLWNDGYRRLAVEAAASAVVGQIKTRTGRTNDQDSPVLQQVFHNEDPKPGQPRLRWPGDPADLTVKSIRDGLARFAPGVQLLVRNPAAHSAAELDEQDALERLCAYSLLARHVAGCKLEQHPDDQPSAQQSP